MSQDARLSSKPVPVQHAVVRKTLSRCCLAWAVAGAIVALSAVPRANADARPLVALASIVFPALAVAAAASARRGAFRSAGLFLLLSAGTPTYFFWVINVPALLAGIALLTYPPATGRRLPETGRP